MEIQALKILITEQEINELARRGLSANQAPVRDLRVGFSPAGVMITGTYHGMMRMPFETLWQVSVRQGKIVAQLSELKFVGFAAAMFRSVLMRSISDAIQAEDALEVGEDCLRLDLDRLLALRGFPTRTNLTLVRCEHGSFHIEANAAAGK